MALGTEASPATDQPEWDIFLAHARADASVAEDLYQHLAPCKVFLASRSLLPGDDWDLELARAQRRSLMTVVIVSAHTDAAYYQREEVAAAIDLARAGGGRHRVIPVYIQNALAGNDDIPYGLRLKHGLSFPECGGSPGVAGRLIDLVACLKSWDRRVVEPQRRALAKLTARAPGDSLAGVIEVMQLFRPVIYTLLALFSLAVLLIVACLLTPPFEARNLALSTLISLVVLILTFLLVAFNRSLNVAQQIVQTGARYE